MAANAALPLWRLYLLRLAYLIMAVGLAVTIWPQVLEHSTDFALRAGIQCSLLAGIGFCAAWGLRYPIALLPILLFEVTWKAIYLLAFALPLWRNDALTPPAIENIQAVLFVVILLPLIPWDLAIKHYLLQPGDRWWRAPKG